MKVTHDNNYIEFNKKLKYAKIDEQIKELKRIIPEQGIFKRRIVRELSRWISIKDRRYKSMASGFCEGAEVASFNVISKNIIITDRSLFYVIKKFGTKYGYKTIHTQYQI